LSACLHLLWCPGVKALETGDGAVVVENSGTRLRLRPPSPRFRDALMRIAPPGEDEGRLADLVADGNGGLARWYYYIERLSRHGLVCYALQAEGARLATLTPISRHFVARSSQLVAGKRYVLSRFAYLRRDENHAVLESPLVHARIVLNHPRIAALVGCLAAPATIDELAAQLAGLSTDNIRGAMNLMMRAGMVQEVGAEATTSEDVNPALQTWAFHDLLFHARSRLGRTDLPYGGTCRLAGQLDSPPALKRPPAGTMYELYRPDLERLELEDPPLARVLEQRRSARTFDRERPIASAQLGEFLYRVARVRDFREIEVTTPVGPMKLETTSRPYPAGGGLYEIEIYLAIQACAGFEAGLHYYDPAQHRLIRLPGRARESSALLADAANSTGVPPDELQVLVILAARFPRLAWKYESIAYSLILKHVGVLYQTMYLAATAMGLAACAVGGGDSDLFCQAAGTQYAAETSVGEFLLGSRKSEPPSPNR
jgi:oxazoline/thiazoline dehydrogenase